MASTRGECVLSDAMAAAVDSTGQRDQNRPPPSRMLGRGSSADGYTRSDNLTWHWSSFTEGTDASASAGRGAPTPRSHPPGPFAVPGEPESPTRRAILAYPGSHGYRKWVKSALGLRAEQSFTNPAHQLISLRPL